MTTGPTAPAATPQADPQPRAKPRLVTMERALTVLAFVLPAATFGIYALFCPGGPYWHDKVSGAFVPTTLSFLSRHILQIMCPALLCFSRRKLLAHIAMYHWLLTFNVWMITFDLNLQHLKPIYWFFNFSITYLLSCVLFWNYDLNTVHTCYGNKPNRSESTIVSMFKKAVYKASNLLKNLLPKAFLLVGLCWIAFCANGPYLHYKNVQSPGAIGIVLAFGFFFGAAVILLFMQSRSLMKAITVLLLFFASLPFLDSLVGCQDNSSELCWFVNYTIKHSTNYLAITIVFTNSTLWLIKSVWRLARLDGDYPI